jgi:hypothetical protein
MTTHSLHGLLIPTAPCKQSSAKPLFAINVIARKSISTLSTAVNKEEVSTQSKRELLSNPAPGVKLPDPTQDGDDNLVQIGGFGSGNIMTEVNQPSNTTWSLPGPAYTLHPGWVRREIVFEGRVNWITNTGGGTGFSPLNLNTNLAALIWGGTNPYRLPADTECACGK